MAKQMDVCVEDQYEVVLESVAITDSNTPVFGLLLSSSGGAASQSPSPLSISPLNP